MRTTSLTMVLLVAASLAGCTGGADDEGQLPTEDLGESETTSTSDTRTSTRAPRGDQGQGTNQSYMGHLEVSPSNGTAPLNVTLQFDVTWCDQGRHVGQDGNGTAGPGGNQTGSSGNQTSTGNGTGGNGSGGNATGNQTSGDGDAACKHPLNPSLRDVTWTLEVVVNGTASNGTAGNGTSGNGTSTSSTTTTSSTTSSTGSTGTSTGPSGNGTGNSTGNGTGNGTGNTTEEPLAHGTVIASFNGTADDLPGNRTVTLNQSGSYDVVFTVSSDEGVEDVVQQTLTVGDMPPGTLLGNETAVFEGSFLASEPLLCLGEEEFEWVLNGTFGGIPAEVGHVNVTVESSGFADVELTLTAPNGTEIQSGSEINASGPFGPGNYTLTVSSCVSVEAEFTATAVAHYVSLGKDEE